MASKMEFFLFFSLLIWIFFGNVSSLNPQDKSCYSLNILNKDSSSKWIEKNCSNSISNSDSGWLNITPQNLHLDLSSSNLNQKIKSEEFVQFNESDSSMNIFVSKQSFWEISSESSSNGENKKVLSINVVGQNSIDSKFSISKNKLVPMKIQGGDGNDVFLINNMNEISEPLEIDGSEGRNSMNVTIRVDDEFPIFLFPGVLEKTSRKNLISFQNIQEQNYIISSFSDSKNQFIISPPINRIYENPSPKSIRSSKRDQTISSCDFTQLDTRIFLPVGNNTVTINGIDILNDYHCTIRIYGSNSSLNTIIINTANQTQMTWIIDQSFLQVWSTDNPQGNYLLLYYTNIDRLIIYFGSQSHTVDMYHGTFPQEVIFNFGTEPSLLNNVRVWSNTNTLLMTGVYSVFVGSDPTQSAPSNPLLNINGMIALIQASTTPGLITLNSGIGSTAPSQTFFMDQTCLRSQNLNLAPIALPSSWMCQILISYGFPSTYCVSPCSLIFLPENKLAFTIQTGGGNDSFIGLNVIANPLIVNLGDSDDTIIFGNSSVVAYLDVGIGSDVAQLISPFSTTSLSIGLDQDVDVVNIFSADLRPPPNYSYQNIISPIGPNISTDILTLQQNTEIDLIYIKRGLFQLN